MSLLFSIVGLPAIVSNPKPHGALVVPNEDPEEGPLQTPTPTVEATKPALHIRAGTYIKDNYRKFCTPPTISTLIALVIALIAPIRGLIFGGDVPLEPLRNASVMLGSCTTPLTILLVGSTMKSCHHI